MGWSLMETRKDYEIHQTIELIREYLETLTILEEQQTDIADKLPFEEMKQNLSMAIKNLEYQLEKEKKPILLTTTVWSSSEMKKLYTNYLPGSICYVLQDNDLYILDTDHEWVKV
jgi:hypothetical protein